MCITFQSSLQDSKIPLQGDQSKFPFHFLADLEKVCKDPSTIDHVAGRNWWVAELQDFFYQHTIHPKINSSKKKISSLQFPKKHLESVSQIPNSSSPTAFFEGDTRFQNEVL